MDRILQRVDQDTRYLNRDEYPARAYREKYGKAKENREVGFELRGKTAVYTVLTGEYDDLSDPAFLDPDLTYICLTNNHALQSDKWQMVYIEDKDLSDFFFSRKLKFLPEIFLSDYDYTIYVDAKMAVTDLKDYVRRYYRGGMLCFPHYLRNCIYDEAAKCLLTGKGDKEMLLTQVANYYGDGYPVDNGLYENACLVRDNRDPVLREVMEAWWQEFLRYPTRDQLSLPYVLWKRHYTVDICDRNIYHNPWMKVKSHKG